MANNTSGLIILNGIHSEAGLSLLVTHHAARSIAECFMLIMCRLSNSAPVATVVGLPDQSTTWYLPKQLLTCHSPFFAAALDGRFAEAYFMIVSLPEDEPAVFGLFVQWLYLGHCKVDSEDNVINLGLIRGFQPAKAWILADKLGCQTFQDRTILQLNKPTYQGPHGRVASHICVPSQCSRIKVTSSEWC